MGRDISITGADRAVLGPLAEHRILITPQVAALLGVGDTAAVRRLQRLERAGLVALRRVFHGLPAGVQITRGGLDALELTLPTPRLDLRGYRHDVGVAWLWLAARTGGFGELEAITADRMMRATDAAATAAGGPARYGVGLGLLGPHGRPQRHYPDLMLDGPGGQRLAVELELTAKSTRRMARIMTAYATDARIDEVLYLVPTPALVQLVRDTARRAGVGDRVHVQRLEPSAIPGVDAPMPRLERRAARARIGPRRGAERAGVTR